MTTFEDANNLTFSKFVAWKIGKAISKRSESKVDKANAVTWFQATVRLILQMSGFGLLTYAGWTVNITVGLVIAGLSCFVLSWLTASPTQRPNQTDNRMR